MGREAVARAVGADLAPELYLATNPAIYVVASLGAYARLANDWRDQDALDIVKNAEKMDRRFLPEWSDAMRRRLLSTMGDPLDTAKPEVTRNVRIALRALTPPLNELRAVLTEVCPIGCSLTGKTSDSAHQMALDVGAAAVLALEDGEFDSWQVEFGRLHEMICEEAREVRWPLNERADAAENERTAEVSSVRHSPDFRSVYWFGEPYSFTANQAPVVRMLYENWRAETFDVGDETLLAAVDSEAPPQRLSVLFRNSSAWNTMIVAGDTKGTHRLRQPG